MTLMKLKAMPIRVLSLSLHFPGHGANQIQKLMVHFRVSLAELPMHLHSNQLPIPLPHGAPAPFYSKLEAESFSRAPTTTLAPNSVEEEEGKL